MHPLLRQEGSWLPSYHSFRRGQTSLLGDVIDFFTDPSDPPVHLPFRDLTSHCSTRVMYMLILIPRNSLRIIYDGSVQSAFHPFHQLPKVLLSSRLIPLKFWFQRVIRVFWCSWFPCLTCVCDVLIATLDLFTRQFRSQFRLTIRYLFYHECGLVK